MALTQKQIVEITETSLKKVIPKTRVQRIEVNRDQPSSDGIKITVIVAAGNTVHLTGAQLSKIQELISTALWEKGDERFPFIRYLTAQEMKRLAS